MQKQTNKYHNKQTMLLGEKFSSRKEAARYQELLLMQRAGLIRNIELQPRYDLVVNAQKLGFYKADFRYEKTDTSEIMVEDVKGGNATKTPVYMLKKKLVKALYDIDIIEV
jgi:hypothetical protein